MSRAKSTLNALKMCKEQIISETFPATSDFGVEPKSDPSFESYSKGVKDCLSVIESYIRQLETKVALELSNVIRPNLIHIDDETPPKDELVLVYYKHDFELAFHEHDDVFDSPGTGFIKSWHWCLLPEFP